MIWDNNKIYYRVKLIIWMIKVLIKMQILFKIVFNQIKIN